MEVIKNLRAKRKEISKVISTRAQLKKRSKDSMARPKAQKKLFDNDPRLQGI